MLFNLFRVYSTHTHRVTSSLLLHFIYVGQRLTICVYINISVGVNCTWNENNWKDEQTWHIKIFLFFSYYFFSILFFFSLFLSHFPILFLVNSHFYFFVSLYALNKNFSMWKISMKNKKNAYFYGNEKICKIKWVTMKHYYQPFTAKCVIWLNWNTQWEGK